MNPVLIVYLIICLFIFIAGVVFMVWDDFVLKSYDPKFGPNWKSVHYWCLLFVLSCPFANLLAALILMINGTREMWKDLHEE